MNVNHPFPQACRQENIDAEVLSLQERLIFDALSLIEYERHRAKRDIPPLTTWQREQLQNERIAAVIFDHHAL